MNERAASHSKGAAPFRLTRADLLACALLVALWLLFFWQLLTPNPADQVSLVEGDFSGQFYAFGAYQARRLLAGEAPLWNPYANGGHPFLADTQAAVFYPPRLLTIYLSSLFGGWSYAALELEAAAHFLLASLLMYALARRVTGLPLAGLAAALTFSYSGYLTGYPILQLAVLEAAAWLPLVLLGIHEAAARPHVNWAWLVLAGAALGLCLLAGHPQTQWFVICLSLAYLAYRLWAVLEAGKRRAWRGWGARLVLGGGLLGAVGGGLAAVQLLPGWEYLQRTTRVGMTFDAKAGGFPFQDVAQFLIPDVVSHWSPLYVGLAGLALALFALWRGARGAAFWGVAALAGLLFSFGGGTVLYPLAYNLLPGASLFRGQERAALVVASSLAMLAGLGAAALNQWSNDDNGWRFARRFLGVLAGVGVILGAMAVMLFVRWRGPDSAAYAEALSPAVFAAMLAVLTLAVFAWRFRSAGGKPWRYALVALVVFDLFSVNMGRNVEPTPPGERPHLTTLATAALADSERPFRVDGREVLGGNYGTLLGLQDIHGISPLRLEQHEGLLNLPEADLWRLMGVRYVFTARAELPVPSEVVAQDEDHYLHRLAAPNPMAWLSPDPQTPLAEVEDASATITAYEPERIEVTVRAAADGYLILSEHHYPGWQATIDGEDAALRPAEFGLRAVAVPAGTHTVELVYAPLSYTVGALISIVTLLFVVAVGLWATLWGAGARRSALAEGLR